MVTSVVIKPLAPSPGRDLQPLAPSPQPLAPSPQPPAPSPSCSPNPSPSPNHTLNRALTPTYFFVRTDCFGQQTAWSPALSRKESFLVGAIARTSGEGMALILSPSSKSTL